VSDGVEPRTGLGWTALGARVLACVSLATALVVRHHPFELVIVLALGVAVVPLAFRRKAAVAPDSVYTASADRLLPDGKQLPGQLSISAGKLIWIPSRFSEARGRERVSVDAGDCTGIALRRDPALFDLIVAARTVRGEEMRFLTRSSRGLRRAVAGLRSRPATGGST
jgi:hypothetical protein